MPLHGKIVVIKRSGGDGTEFPLTATCLFGRKPDCDIRIQLPQVSKEHCRIDLNENKEVVLTNLSSVNPTRVNGEALQQSERLKHGDVITIIDRSFRFEYPPAPTPKKRSSTGGKVLEDRREADGVETSEKRIPEVSTDPHLKDGTNHENIQRSLEKTLEMESKGDDNLLQNKTVSPFSDLYQMIKKSLDVGTPRKSSASLLQTPTSRFCTPKPGSVRKGVSKLVINTEDKSAPVKDEVSGEDQSKGCADSLSNGTPKSVKKQRKSIQLPTTEIAGSTAQDEHSAKSEATLPQKRTRSSPQRFMVCEGHEHISAQSPKSPLRRRSKEATPAKPAVTEPQKEMCKKRKSGELGDDLPTQPTKKKRVSFGGYLSPELFDKRLPPDSPLRKGAMPRRSLCLPKPKLSLLRRASVIGYLKEFEQNKKSPSAKNASPKTPKTGKKSPKSKTPSPKAASPAKKSPKSKTPSPKATSPAKKSPKSKTPSPKAASPAKKSPKSKTPSPKATSPAKKSPKSKTPSPKAASPAKKSPKSKTPSPKAASPAKKSPKSKTPSPEVKKQPNVQSTTPCQVACSGTPTSKRRSSMFGLSGTPQEIAQSIGITPAKTPSSSRVQTPTVQGRFSVSRISTPSPSFTQDTVLEQLPSLAITPKIPLRRMSMKTTSRKTPKVAKSAVKVMRRSGISRASMKVINSWADIVKFGQTKTQVTAPAKNIVTKKPTKKTVPKPKTPARKPKGHVSTGHADSPVTIVVGKAYKQKVVYPTGAAPRVVTNAALFKKDMTMDEDLSGLPEMFKTPLNEKKRPVSNDNVTKTPVGSVSVMEPSVLTTPEEPGEMMVSPLSVASAVKDRRYNSEAVQRLLNADQESSFVSDIPPLELTSDSSEQHSTDLKTTSVTTPKQKPEPVMCLTGVKRIMKTPRQKAEPVEDIRGKLLKTPKQKPEPAECLTGVKRIMKTPRQKAEPVEDIRGRLLVTPKHKPPQQECFTGLKKIMATPKGFADVSLDGVKELLQTPAHVQVSKDPTEMTGTTPQTVKRPSSVCLTTQEEESLPVEDMVGVKRLKKTPKEKGKPVEDNFGIKRLMKSPRLRGNAPVEDFEGLQELMEEPLPDSTGHVETNEVENQTNAERGIIVAEDLVIVHEESQDTVMSQLYMTKEAGEVVDNHMEGVMENITLAAVDGHSPAEESKMDTVDHLSEEHLEAENTAAKVTEVCSVLDHEKKSRGRRAKVAESKTSEDKHQVVVISEDAVVHTPVRGRRGKKTQTTAPPGVTQKTRNRSKDVELTMEESAAQASEVAFGPKRGRYAKKTSQVQAEVQEISTETEADFKQSVSVSVDHKAAESAASLEKTAAKPRRGRKTKAEAEGAETTLEPVTESLPQVEMVTCTEVEAAVVKKSVRGRRAKIMESKVPETPEDAAIPAPVRGRRGKKTETAPPAVRQTLRSRNAQSQESASIQPEAIEEISAEAVNDQTSTINTSQENNDSAPPAEVKTTRGRKTKTQVEPPQPKPEKKEVVSDQLLVSDAQLLQPVEKPRRGKKTGTVEAKKVPEDTVITAEMPVGRAKRGRTAKQEGKLENESMEELVAKSRKTRKTEQEAREEIQTTETVEDVVEVPLVAEPVMMNEQSAVAAKPRRGGRKTKAASETPVESTVVQEVPAADKPKRGTRGKRIVESKVTAEVPKRKADHDLEAVEQQTTDPEPVVKSSRTRGVRTEPSLNISAKRACRGAAVALEESIAASAVLLLESGSVEPAKRGRRAVAKPTVHNATRSSGQENASEDLSCVVEDTKTSKRSVKWKTDVEVYEIPKGTPIKPVRGRKSKAGEQVEAENKNVAKDVNNTEEKDLSDKTEEAQPVKRARRGTKVTDEAESSSKMNPEKGAEAETQPKTRRGRPRK